MSRAPLLSRAQPGSVRGKPGPGPPLWGDQGFFPRLSAHSTATSRVAQGSSRCFGKVLSPVHRAGKWTRLSQVAWQPLFPSGVGGRCGARPITGLFLGRGACGREQEVLSEWGLAGPRGRTLSWGVEISIPPLLTGRGWGLRQPPPAGTRGQRGLLGPTPTGSSQHRELPHYLGGQPGTPAWGLRGREMTALGLTSWYNSNWGLRQTMGLGGRWSERGPWRW